MLGEFQVDGNGGWWCCRDCGSFAGLTIIKNICTYCGGVGTEQWYPDEEYK